MDVFPMFQQIGSDAVVRALQALVLSTILAGAPSAVQAQPSMTQEPTDAYIRRKAGLPAASARGDIEILDVGHLPLSTMLSIVASHGPTGWRVSYACADSPHCGAGDQDHAAADYTLAPETAAKLDALLDALRTMPEAGGTAPRPELICGHLAISIDYQGFQRDYRRACVWGPVLGQLEDLLRPPEPQAP